MPILICEDNQNHLSLIKQIVRECIAKNNLDFKIIRSSTIVIDILNYLETEKSDLAIYFLDVELKSPLYDGIQLGNMIRKVDDRSYLIYLTCHQEAAIKTYDNGLACTDFILKRSWEETRDRIENCLIKIQQEIQENAVKGISFLYNHQRIYADKVQYIESSDLPHRIILHCENDIIEMWGTLTELMKLLPKNFCQCHRGVIINLKKVCYINEKEKKIYFRDGISCQGSAILLKKLKRIEPVHFYKE